MALKNLRGRVAFVFTEPDFDVDQIVGVKNIKLRDPGELAALAMQAYDPAFAGLVRPGDLLVGADNFGFFLGLKVLRFQLGLLGLEGFDVAIIGAQRLALRQQEVAGVAVLDVHDLAHLAKLGHTFQKDHLHGRAPYFTA